MINRKKNLLRLRISIDVLLLILTFFLAVYLAKHHAEGSGKLFALETSEAVLLLILSLAWRPIAKYNALYDELRLRSWSFEIGAIAKSVLLGMVIEVFFLFIVKTSILSRFFILTNATLFLGVLIAWRMTLRFFLKWLNKNNHCMVLIVGAGDVGQKFHLTLDSNPQIGFRVSGFIDDCPKPDLGDLYLGSIDQLEKIIMCRNIDEVIVALPNSAISRLDYIISICDNYPVRLRIIPDYFRYTSPRFKVSYFGSFPLISIRANPLEDPSWRLCKRAVDLFVTLLLFAAVFSWLWPLLALLIKATSSGPVFFKQERWGKKNRRFLCYKFRSMVKESRDVDEKGCYRQAQHGDPRVTRVGRFLRRSNLDELPQFINVLKGEMTLVGPRPHPTPMNLEASGSIRHYQLRHLVKPGITGWAQVSGLRGETSDPDMLRRRIEADIWYIENWSFLLDIKILLLTAWNMLKGDANAY